MPGDELVEAAQARRRRERQLGSSVAQQPEQPAHLAQRLLAGVLDDVERAARLVGVVGQHAAARRAPAGR